MLLLLALTMQVYSQVNHVEPLNCWTGMKSPYLQLMIHEEDIAGSQVQINYPGIDVRAVSTLNNPNYLFIDLELDPDLKAGTCTIELKKNNQDALKIPYDFN